MAKKVYIGVGGTLRKVKKMYIGINGALRKVKKAYVGVNGALRQFFTSAEDTLYACPNAQYSTLQSLFNKLDINTFTLTSETLNLPRTFHIHPTVPLSNYITGFDGNMYYADFTAIGTPPAPYNISTTVYVCDGSSGALIRTFGSTLTGGEFAQSRNRVVRVHSIYNARGSICLTKECFSEGSSGADYANYYECTVDKNTGAQLKVVHSGSASSPSGQSGSPISPITPFTATESYSYYARNGNAYSTKVTVAVKDINTGAVLNSVITIDTSSGTCAVYCMVGGTAHLYTSARYTNASTTSTQYQRLSKLDQSTCAVLNHKETSGNFQHGIGNMWGHK